jgi:hypothetical protein
VSGRWWRFVTIGQIEKMELELPCRQLDIELSVTKVLASLTAEYYETTLISGTIDAGLDTL